MLLHTIGEQRRNTDEMKVLHKNWKFAKHDENQTAHYLLFVRQFYTNCLCENSLGVHLKTARR